MLTRMDDLFALPELAALWMAYRGCTPGYSIEAEPALDERLAEVRPEDKILWAGALHQIAQRSRMRHEMASFVRGRAPRALNGDDPEHLQLLSLADVSLAWINGQKPSDASLAVKLDDVQDQVVAQFDTSQARVIAWAGAVVRAAHRAVADLRPVDRSPLFYALASTPEAWVEIALLRVRARLPDDARVPAFDALLRALLPELLRLPYVRQDGAASNL